jgi:hypothetical protein
MARHDKQGERFEEKVGFERRPTFSALLLIAEVTIEVDELSGQEMRVVAIILEELFPLESWCER